MSPDRQDSHSTLHKPMTHGVIFEASGICKMAQQYIFGSSPFCQVNCDITQAIDKVGNPMNAIN